MCSCLRQSSALPKKLFISNVISSSKSFSALSKIPGRHNSNYDTNNLFKNISTPKQIQYRYFSLDNMISTFESMNSTEIGKLATNTLIGVHDFTGLSWTGTIIATSVAMKFLLAVPCALYQRILMTRMDQTKVELDDEVKKLKELIATKKEAVKGQWTQLEFEREVRQIRKTLLVKNNCHPFKIPLLFLVQLPFWLLLSVTIKSLAEDAYFRNFSKVENPVTAFLFQVGGPSWCRNLSLPDEYYILPFLTAAGMLINIEISLLSGLQGKITKKITVILLHYFLRGIAAVFFFVSAALPSAVSLFWATNSLFSLCQTLLLLSPRLRRVLRIPKTSSELDKPYSYIFNKLVQNFNEFVQKFRWKK